MSHYVPSLELLGRAEASEPAAIGRLISRAEANVPEVRAALSIIYQKAGLAHVIGLTGVPGGGKSTLVAALTGRFRTIGEKVGIVAVDPSSPYSGGSILGDRIRMTELANDPGVYIRSMATHGASGGLARATLDAVDILDVSGFRTIIIETVGVGQNEVEIAKAAHTIIVVSAPGLGDEIQAIKAGLLEIADIHVVSKCDRVDANRTLVDIKQMMTLAAANSEKPEWQIPILGVSSYSSEGLDELVKVIEQHRGVAFKTETGRRKRQLSIANFRLAKTAEHLLIERFAKKSAAFAPSIVARLQRRESDPYSLASELVAASLT